MNDVSPLGTGRGQMVEDGGALEITFPLAEIMVGWRMTSAGIDETGHFLHIRMERQA